MYQQNHIGSTEEMRVQSYMIIVFFSGPRDHHVLWNAMIHPLLKFTIYGAIWYQGTCPQLSVTLC